MESGGLKGCDLVCDRGAVRPRVFVARRGVEAEELVTPVEGSDVRLRGLVVAALDLRREGAEHELDALQVDVQRVSREFLALGGCGVELFANELVRPLARHAEALADHQERVPLDVKLQRGLSTRCTSGLR